MTSQSNDHPLVKRDLADYGVSRLRDQAFDAVRALWQQRQASGWTQKMVAEAIGRDPGWVSKNLRAPGNWTLRIVGELVQGLGGEIDFQVFPQEQARSDRSNYDAYDGYVSKAPRLNIEVQAPVHNPHPPVAMYIDQPNTYNAFGNETFQIAMAENS